LQQIALCKRLWNRTVLQYCSKFNCHHTAVSFLYPQHYFRTQNNKSNDLYLLVMAQCNWRTRSWTRQTLGTSPQCAMGREQENSEIYKPLSLPKTCMGKWVV